jgi:CheY-like chemotaxis protein
MGGGLRVLVVEDEALIRMMIEEFLGELGYQVAATAAQLADGLRKAKITEIDVAVLDINLQGQLSYPIALTLKDRGIPFIFATGYGTSGVPHAFEGVPILAKPFGIDELEHGLHRATTNRTSSNTGLGL